MLRFKKKIILSIYSLILFTSGIFFQKLGIFGLIIKPGIANPIETIEKFYSSYNSKPEQLNLILSNKDLAKLEKQRDNALNLGRGHRTINSDEKYIKAKIVYLNDTLPTKLKVKGGISSHYRDHKKTSLKFKLNDNYNIKGMQKFALCNPLARKYLNEWFFHELNKHIGIIHLRYNYVELSTNNKSHGIFCLEENMGKELLINNNKPLGPIISFDPEIIWKQNSDKVTISPDGKDLFNQSSFKIYNNKDFTTDSSKLIIDEAVLLLEKFKNKKAKTSEVFHVENMAKYMAILNLYGNYHSLGLWNLKFYYNPNEKLLEPIPYDQTHFELNNFDGNIPLIGQYEQINRDDDYNSFSSNLFSDSLFFATYNRYCIEYSKKEFLNSFFKTFSTEISKNISILNKEYWNYNFDNETDILYKNQTYLNHVYQPNECIKVKIEASEKNKILNISNFYSLPIVINSITINDSIAHPLKNKLILNSHIKNTILKSTPIELLNFNFSLNNIEIYYSILGTNREIKSITNF